MGGRDDERRRWRGRDDHARTVALVGMPILAHLDLDAFFAAVEELEDPALRELPLVVGGDPHGRGVVATANYNARRFGIHSAMSAAEALRRCPEVVFVRPRHTLYRQYSNAVWAAIGETIPRIERTGLDEGYLDLGSVVGEFREARGARRDRAACGARRDVALVLARSLDLEGRLQGRLGRPEAGRHHHRPTWSRGALPRTASRARPPRGRPQGRGEARRRRGHDGRGPRRPQRSAS